MLDLNLEPSTFLIIWHCLEFLPSLPEFIRDHTCRGHAPRGFRLALQPKEGGVYTERSECAFRSCESLSRASHLGGDEGKQSPSPRDQSGRWIEEYEEE